MKKNDCLALAIKTKRYEELDWVISAFAMTRRSKEGTRAGEILNRPWGYSVRLGDGTEEKIDDAKPGAPLFTFKDKILVTEELAANYKGSPAETTVGDLLANLILLVANFGDKIPYMFKGISIKAIEAKIAPILTSIPEPGATRDPKRIYVDERNRFVEAKEYISEFTPLCAYSATEKNILPPPGIEKFKKQLLQELGDDLTNPVTVAKYDKALQDFDNKYLEGDPSNGIFVKGKIKETSRKKLFLSVSAEVGFGDKNKANVVIPSLEEGWPKDPVQFSYVMNGTRSGSFSRGAETIKGGVLGKDFIRAVADYKILDRDCGTNLGIDYFVTKSFSDLMVGRYVLAGSQPKLVENTNDAGNYLGKTVRLRSTMYCREDKGSICRVCSGENLFKYKEGLVIPVTELSLIILYADMKAMHANVTATKELILEDVMS